MDWSGCEFVERVTGRMGGVPTVIDSRVTPESVLENFEDGMTAEEISDEYSLDMKKVQGVLSYVRSQQNLHAA